MAEETIMNNKTEKSGTVENFSINTICQLNGLLGQLREVVECHQDEDARQIGLSVVHLLENEDRKSLECLKILVGKYPGISILQQRLAETYISLQEDEKAIPHFEQAVKLDKKNYTAMIWLALCYYRSSSPEKGSVIFDWLREKIYLLHIASCDSA